MFRVEKLKSRYRSVLDQVIVKAAAVASFQLFNSSTSQLNAPL